MNKTHQAEFLKTFGSRVRQYRMLLGLSIEELSNRCDPPIHHNHLGAIERGKKNPSIWAIKGIACGLGIDMKFLLDFEDDILKDGDKNKNISEIISRVKKMDLDLLNFIAHITQKTEELVSRYMNN